MQTELTIISVYYDHAQYQLCLGASLADQTGCSYQLLLVDNSGGAYPNMAAAIHSVRGQVEGDFVLLVHPDIRLPQADTLARILAEAKSACPPYAILGGAGADGDDTGNWLISSLVQESGIRPGAEPDGITPCMTLDESVAIVPRAVFDAYPLLDLGAVWHMYIVELCLRLRLSGKCVGVFTTKTVHASLGCKDRSYYRTMAKVARLYHGRIPYVYTTCSAFPTGTLPLFLFRLNVAFRAFREEGPLKRLNGAYARFASSSKSFMLRRVPGSRGFFHLTEKLFHAQRERIRKGRKTDADADLNRGSSL